MKIYVRCEATNYTMGPFKDRPAAERKIESIAKGKDTCQEEHEVIEK